jgi:hypothetical protein
MSHVVSAWENILRSHLLEPSGEHLTQENNCCICKLKQLHLTITLTELKQYCVDVFAQIDL